uniref:Retrovirus-related Pol polyprotein from transposon TNT 1-94-like beta-barrel domain-containing protein n=1 Tax=Globisporangium ultimum (strain ATCC 200006 / CBS 805.95 / DAOM BR144) TaxID=431595 RepID=K3WQQ7_GLOUD
MVDSGCTRHTVYQIGWLKIFEHYTGSITVGGKKELPITGIGVVNLQVTNSKGVHGVITLKDVLYVPDMRFNLLSVAQALKNDFRLTFSRSDKRIFFYGKDFKLHARLA